jgi:hypothetical protein
MSFRMIAQQIGDLVEAKNAAYGSSFAKTSGFLGLLYPNGILPEQYADALLITRIFDKLQRIATDRDALGESPYRDIAGYGILGAALHENDRKENNGRTSVPAARLHKPGQASSSSVLLGEMRARTISRRNSRPAVRRMPQAAQARKTTKKDQ